uniref:hypothetical protein n=1 Tax=Hahella ganghwensis TaxID=286420 RepID=UPI00052658E6
LSVGGLQQSADGKERAAGIGAVSPDDAPQGGKIQNGRKNTLNIRPYIVESLNYLRTLGLFRLSLDL